MVRQVRLENIDLLQARTLQPQVNVAIVLIDQEHTAQRCKRYGSLMACFDPGNERYARLLRSTFDSA